MNGVVDRLSMVRDILEDGGIDQIHEEDWTYAIDNRKVLSALQDGKLNIITLVNAFTDISRVIYEINKAVNE